MNKQKYMSIFALSIVLTSSISPTVLNATQIIEDVLIADGRSVAKPDLDWQEPTDTLRNDEMFNLYNSYGVNLIPQNTKVESGKVSSSEEDTYYHFSNQNPSDILVRYENVATYRNQKLDVLLSFNDYSINDESNYDIAVYPNKIGFNISGLNNVEFEIDIVKSGTNESMPISFILQATDIDGLQYLGLPTAQQEHFMITDGSLLKYANYGEYSVFGNLPRSTEYEDYYDTLMYADKAENIKGVWGTEFDTPYKEYVGFDIRLAPEPDTIIKKIQSDENNDHIVQVGETVDYTISVTNTSEYVDAIDVPVRDSLLENLPEYLTFNNDVTISNNLDTSGSLMNGDYLITSLPAGQTATITYSLTLNSAPDDGAEAITNIVTDTGTDPEVCEEADHEIDCDETILPIEPDTVIYKSVSDENEDNIAQVGEVLNYTIKVENNNTIDASNVPVRDSLIENTPEYLTFNDDVVVFGSDYSGSLSDGSLVLDTVGAKDTIEITYSMTLNSKPSDTDKVVNIATDNGADPEVCEEANHEIDCDETILPIEPDTVIYKSVSDENEDNIAQVGEVLNYTIKVENNNTIDASNVPVRDSLIESTPEYLTFNDDVKVFGSDYSGSLSDGSLVLDTVGAKDTIEITYSMTLNSKPSDTDKVVNIATDNGADPEVCEEANHEIDCDETILPIEPDTVIYKSVSDVNEDNIAQVGEVLNYTIKVENNNTIDASNVPVRDSLIENTPEYLTFNDDVEVFGSDYSGSLSDGSLVLDTVGAKDTIEITYSMTLNSKPSDTDKVVNIATDNGADPEVCEEAAHEIDCDETILPIEPDTVIYKSVSDENEDNIAQVGEVLNYTIKVENNNTIDASNVPVRDSLIESTPEYLTFNDDVKVFGSDYSGSLSDGSLVLDTVGAKDTIEITYSMTLNSKPSDTDKVVNIATDNGTDPEVCEEAAHEIDCDETTTPIETIKPEIELPEIELPEIELPEIELPEIDLPEITDPETKEPDSKTEITEEDDVEEDNLAETGKEVAVIAFVVASISLVTVVFLKRKVK